VTHWGGEAVATARNGLDVWTSIGTLTEHLAQIKDARREIAFFDENARPDFLQEFFLFDYVTGPFDQDEKGLEIFWSERDGLPVTEQDALSGVEAIRAEAV
jgi:hypothetical protein